MQCFLVQCRQITLPYEVHIDVSRTWLKEILSEDEICHGMIQLKMEPFCSNLSSDLNYPGHGT